MPIITNDIIHLVGKSYRKPSKLHSTFISRDCNDIGLLRNFKAMRAYYATSKYYEKKQPPE